MIDKPKIAVFASGSGSNFQSIADHVKRGWLDAEIVLLVCDKPGAPVTEKARLAEVPVLELSLKSFESKAAYEAEILSKLNDQGAEWLILAGYMRLIGPVLLDAFPTKIINLHPSLLPKFPGKDAIERAFESGDTETGITIHYVDEGMDTGPIIDQLTVAIPESLEQLKSSIHKAEHAFFPAVLQHVLKIKTEVKQS
ncbi:phosphoribosylglycinamide formyltransferase [Bacillus sp. FJAT-42376]|uniref:phosphoribosylglycinamide formyltransferase n=1 Tax=Bacillus sp. FJAT-42376 TaxID=2014076 RepID=UPI000F4E055E|nr:phosphoribosylglycinamide formyltransferase [Bacillus sp. FJAT-42376]AZB41468.1 phosphoribosylglycinamide formyltransferase [Bacillus sp. FJAT-42376]